jgi:hypothetical protein
MLRTAPPADLVALQRTIASRLSCSAQPGKELGAEATSTGASRSSGSGEVDRKTEEDISRLRSSGQPLDGHVRAAMEAFFKSDLGRVRVHTGPEPHSLNRALNARAFTSGWDVFFAGGEYQPRTGAGRQLLAHELTHVLQQSGASPTVSMLRRQPNAGGATDAGTTMEPDAGKAAEVSPESAELTPEVKRLIAAIVLAESEAVDDSPQLEKVAWIYHNLWRNSKYAGLASSKAYKEKQEWFRFWMTVLGSDEYASTKPPEKSADAKDQNMSVFAARRRSLFAPRAAKTAELVQRTFDLPERDKQYKGWMRQGHIPDFNNESNDDKSWAMARQYYWLQQKNPNLPKLVEILSAATIWSITVIFNDREISAYFAKHPADVVKPWLNVPKVTPADLADYVRKKSTKVSPKLVVGEPDDPCEREAEQNARAVLLADTTAVMTPESARMQHAQRQVTTSAPGPALPSQSAVAAPQGSAASPAAAGASPPTATVKPPAGTSVHSPAGIPDMERRFYTRQELKAIGAVASLAVLQPQDLATLKLVFPSSIDPKKFDTKLSKPLDRYADIVVFQSATTAGRFERLRYLSNGMFAHEVWSEPAAKDKAKSPKPDSCDVFYKDASLAPPLPAIDNDQVEKGLAELMTSEDPVVLDQTMKAISSLADPDQFIQVDKVNQGVAKQLLPKFKALLESLDLVIDMEGKNKTEVKQPGLQLQAPAPSQPKWLIEDESAVFNKVKEAMESFLVQEADEARAAAKAGAKEGEPQPKASDVRAQAVAQAASIFARKSAVALCFVVSHYLYGRLTKKIPKEKPFSEWYVERLLSGHISARKYPEDKPKGSKEGTEPPKTVGVGFFMGAGWFQELRDQWGMEEGGVKDLEDSGARLAISHQDTKGKRTTPNHWLLIVKDDAGVWRNMNHASSETEWHSAPTRWENVYNLFYNPHAEATAPSATPAEPKGKAKSSQSTETTASPKGATSVASSPQGVEMQKRAETLDQAQQQQASSNK